MLWWEDIFRGLFFFIDRGIHWLIVQLYDIFLSLASFELFEPELLQEFSTRIYGFLGVFMLFRITFSLITYLVNPDQINDKNNGIGKIVINVVVVLALILMVPTIFEMAMDLQKMIIQDNTVGKLVLGITDVGEDAQQNPGGTISWTLFSAFLIDNTDVSCDNATVARSNYQKAKSKKDMNLLSQDESYNAKCKDSAGTEKYVFTYHPLVAVIASIFTAYILITYCVQVGFRTIKLGLLQLLAPIPIISIIDPKSSKNGAFSSWLKMCINTYLEIFVRLATLSFLILVKVCPI